MEEIWKDIPEYEGLYQVSNLGIVKSLSREVKRKNIGSLPLKERILKTHLEKNGYLTCSLSKNNIRSTKRIHQLVALSFLNHTPNFYEKVINHIDGNKQNNSLDNLEIVTPKQNVTECFMPEKNTHKRVYSSSTKNILFRKDRNKWIVQVKIDNKRKSLGSFNTEEEAIIRLNEYKNL